MAKRHEAGTSWRFYLTTLSVQRIETNWIIANF
nr:MAG TPA: hypothetical protein [Caudoviricetes sp.]